MGVPKRKTSKMRLRTRKASHRWQAPQLNKCAQCGSTRRLAYRLPFLRLLQGPPGADGRRELSLDESCDALVASSDRFQTRSRAASRVSASPIFVLHSTP